MDGVLKLNITLISLSFLAADFFSMSCHNCLCYKNFSLNQNTIFRSSAVSSKEISQFYPLPIYIPLEEDVGGSWHSPASAQTGQVAEYSSLFAYWKKWPEEIGGKCWEEWFPSIEQWESYHIFWLQIFPMFLGYSYLCSCKWIFTHYYANKLTKLIVSSCVNFDEISCLFFLGKRDKRIYFILFWIYMCLLVLHAD